MVDIRITCEDIANKKQEWKKMFKKKSLLSGCQKT